jgi:hypothetical protein
MTAPAEVFIRSFRASDQASVARLWTEVFPDDPPRNAPDLMIVEERISMGRALE